MTCKWEDFPDRGDLMESLKIQVRSPIEKKRKILKRQEIKEAVRKRYNVHLSSTCIMKQLPADFHQATDQKFRGCSATFLEEELIRF